MARRKDIDEKSALPAEGATAATPVGETKAAEMVETKLAEPAVLVTDAAPKIEEPKAAAIEFSKIEHPKIEHPISELPLVDAPKLADLDAVTADARSPELADSNPPRGNRFVLLAASVAVAAAIGATAGALAAAGLLQPPSEVAEAAPMPTVVDETRALLAAVTQLKTELVAIKSSVDAGSKTTNGQFAKLAERFDRVERAQAEPAGKMAKISESLDQLEKRVEGAKETTGSVTAPQTAAASTSGQPPALQSVEGWILRDVYQGAAMIQGRRFGMLEVEPGDVIPGVGRVESIRRQDGRWVVVTPRGVITSPR